MLRLILSGIHIEIISHIMKPVEWQIIFFNEAKHPCFNLHKKKVKKSSDANLKKSKRHSSSRLSRYFVCLKLRNISQNEEDFAIFNPGSRKKFLYSLIKALTISRQVFFAHTIKLKMNSHPPSRNLKINLEKHVPSQRTFFFSRIIQWQMGFKT